MGATFDEMECSATGCFDIPDIYSVWNARLRVDVVGMPRLGDFLIRDNGERESIAVSAWMVDESPCFMISWHRLYTC